MRIHPGIHSLQEKKKACPVVAGYGWNTAGILLRPAFVWRRRVSGDLVRNQVELWHQIRATGKGVRLSIPAGPCTYRGRPLADGDCPKGEGPRLGLLIAGYRMPQIRYGCGFACHIISTLVRALWLKKTRGIFIPGRAILPEAFSFSVQRSPFRPLASAHMLLAISGVILGRCVDQQAMSTGMDLVSSTAAVDAGNDGLMYSSMRSLGASLRVIQTKAVALVWITSPSASALLYGASWTL